MTLIVSATSAIVLSLAIALVALVPNSNVIAAMFPPWWDAATIFEAAAAAGDPVRVGRLPWVVIVRGDPAQLAKRLHAAGAFLVMDSRFFAGCGFQ
ncbi:hypothetical protein [Beijerinckia sp. L45]|uniref:hypothetical protein n=1 Tax=Beijerinckia sp. L45 TaxID=1641855 RepID=UPI00131E1760|nr:hypothetical protein [Beijerinckia sp. L45]